MSDERQETIDDIVKEIRGNAEHNHALVEASKYLTEIADRIEAAIKREREAGAEAAQICGEIGEIIGSEATREKSSAVGNAAAKHQFREVAKMIPHEEVDVSKMETTTPTSDKSSAVGNAAKMREALITLRQRFYNDVMAYQDRYFKFSGWHWNKKAEEAARWRDVFNELLEVVDAALSAPPRNCDVLSDPQEALEAIHEDRCYVNNPIDERRLTVEWLFAEAKGETDGSK